MADAIGSATRIHGHEVARSHRRRDDMWIAATALLAALLALPLAQSSWHGPEAAAVLAVSATAMFARQRWAIAVVVIAELLLAPTVASRAFFGGLALWPGRVAALGALVAIVPGLLALRRAAAALVIITGQRRTRTMHRRFHVGLLAVGVLALLLPLV